MSSFFPTNLFSELARIVRVVDDLVVENGKVERKAESYRMSRCQIGLGNNHRCFVCLL